MAVWFMRWLQCLHCVEFALLRAPIAIDAGSPVTPTNHRRNNVLRMGDRAHALNHAGAII
jgi:hypothetical protein